MEVLVTIIPIFAVILIGWAARQKKFITDEFVKSANRLVYSFSIPALIFNAIAKTSFHQQFDIRIVSLTILVLTGMYLTAYGITRLAKMPRPRAVSFILCTSHGNLGYLGLPIAFYYLDEKGFASAGIICGFVMIAQNMLSVIFTEMFQNKPQKTSRGRNIIGSLTGNPVIIGAVTGMTVSITGVAIPQVIWRTISILGALAPPMALLLIGASLSLKLVRGSLGATFGAMGLKLIGMPLSAIILFQLAGIATTDCLPAIILLCSPAATIIYIMVSGTNGDADFAVTQISLGTLFSALTFIGWLALLPRLAN
jgi:predicted permease